MSVTRIHKTTDYTVMSNHHLKNRELSLKAKGLLSVMLSLPDDWDYSILGLVAICKENETAVRSALDELKEQGYLIVTKLYANKSRSGKIEYDYDVYEQPNLACKNQALENLGVEELAVEKQGQLNTNTSNTNKSNTKSNDYGKASLPPLSIKKGLINNTKPNIGKKPKSNRNALNAVIAEFEFSNSTNFQLTMFLDMIEESTKWLTEISFRSQLCLLSTLSEDCQIQVIYKTIARGWGSLDYAIEEVKKGKTPSFETATKSENQIYVKGTPEWEERQRLMQEDIDNGNVF